MLQVARLAPSLLAEAAPLVATFLEEQFQPDGGACDRSGKSDLYYTAFALDGLVALQHELPAARVIPYLESFGNGSELDLVHRACLVRCWSALGGDWPGATFQADTLTELERHRSGDGGYGREPGMPDGTLYDAFLALGIYQDFGASLPEPERLAQSFERLRASDGAYANSADLRWGTTPSTAAAAAILGQLELDVPPEIGPWLRAQQHIKGGFKAMPDAPIPDLLSTATSLHALAYLGETLGPGKEPALDFLDSLWSGRSFYGHWADEDLDCEYTFYALLALGHLAAS